MIGDAVLVRKVVGNRPVFVVVVVVTAGSRGGARPKTRVHMLEETKGKQTR